MLGIEIPEIYITLRNKLEEWSIATGDNLPENLTKDWYLREPVKNNEWNKKEKQVTGLKIMVYAGKCQDCKQCHKN